MSRLPRHGEQRQRETIQVGHHRRIESFYRGHVDRLSLGATAHGPRHVQLRRNRASPGKNEGAQRWELRIDLFDIAIERRHLGGAQAYAVAIAPGHLRAEDIKVVLNSSQSRDGFRHACRRYALFQSGAGQPEKGRQLVDAAYAFDARVVLANAVPA